MCNWNSRRWQCFWQLHYNSLLVCRARLLSWSLHITAENKCLVIEDNPVTLCCAPRLSHWPLWETDDAQEQCCPVYCSHTDIAAPHPIMWQGHISDWSDPNSDLPLERTVFENGGRGERQGRVSYKCHIQQLLCFQWHLNWNRHAQQGTGFKIFFIFFPILQKDYHVEELVGVSVCVSTEQRWNSRASRPVYCLWWQCSLAA